MSNELRNDPEWSTPYYGVSHRYVNGRQCTIEDHGTFTIATVFGGRGVMLSDARTRDFETAEAARQWCEREAR